MLGPPASSVLLGLTPSSCWPVLSSLSTPSAPGPLTCPAPSLLWSPVLRGEGLPEHLPPHQDRWVGRVLGPRTKSRGLCSQAHIPAPTATMARPRPVGVCPSPGLCNSQSVPLPSRLGSGCPSVPLLSMQVLFWAGVHHARVTWTARFKASAAAEALPPIRKKPDLFHILINQCEFL